MPRDIEPSKDGKKLAEYFIDDTIKNVLIFFAHGLGDVIMFMKPFEALKNKYPLIKFDFAILRGLDQESVYSEAVLVDAQETTDFSSDRFKHYDIVARINFPMSEGQEKLTKGEWCCVHELGIDPICGHTILNCPTPNRLVAVHFNITCLPGACNPDKETAEKIWNEILEAGMIPIESHFEHVFHNPVNTKFDFVDCTVRRVKPQVSTLTGLITSCAAFIGVVSGNFHVAMSVLPENKIALLEKDFTAPMFTKKDIKRIDIKKYKDGSVKEWLLK